MSLETSVSTSFQPALANRYLLGKIFPRMKSDSLEKAIERESKEKLGLEVKFEKLAGYVELICAPYHVLAFSLLV